MGGGFQVGGRLRIRGTFGHGPPGSPPGCDSRIGCRGCLVRLQRRPGDQDRKIGAPWRKAVAPPRWHGCSDSHCLSGAQCNPCIAPLRAPTSAAPYRSRCSTPADATRGTRGCDLWDLWVQPGFDGGAGGTREGHWDTERCSGGELTSAAISGASSSAASVLGCTTALSPSRSCSCERAHMLERRSNIPGPRKPTFQLPPLGTIGTQAVIAVDKDTLAGTMNRTAGGTMAAEAIVHLVQLAATLLHLAEPQYLAHGAKEALGAPMQLQQGDARTLASNSNRSTISEHATIRKADAPAQRL